MEPKQTDGIVRMIKQVQAVRAGAQRGLLGQAYRQQRTLLGLSGTVGVLGRVARARSIVDVFNAAAAN